MPNHRLRDVIIVLPGITGSVLSTVDRKGAKNDVWAVSGGALWKFLKTMGGSLDELAVVTHDPAAKDPVETSLVATRLVGGFHGVFGLAQIDGYSTLVKAIIEEFKVAKGRFDDDRPTNLIEFPYDWRLSCRQSAARLKEMIDVKLAAWRLASDEADAQVIIIAHSLGGLVARYWLEVLEGWSDCKMLVTFGTPYRGSIDAVGYLANGYKKAFLNLADVLRSCPSVYELLPIYRGIQTGNEWRRVSDIELPNANPTYVERAVAFHDEIKRAVARHRQDADYMKNRYKIFPFVGVKQTTFQSAHLDGKVLNIGRDLPDWIDAGYEGGDGRVPRVSATPIEMSDDYGETFFGEQHGSLQNNPYALDDLIERIKQSQSTGLSEVQGKWESRRTVIDVEVDDLFLQGEPVIVRARVVGGEGGVAARLHPDGGLQRPLVLTEGGRGFEARIEGLKAGRYRVAVAPRSQGGRSPLPVTAVFEVAG